MSWKLANTEILDNVYFSQMKKYNPELIYTADNLTDCIQKLNKDGVKSKIMFVGSMKSNRGYVCFNNTCITEKEALSRIIESYKTKHGIIQQAINDSKTSRIKPFYINN